MDAIRNVGRRPLPRFAALAAALALAAPAAAKDEAPRDLGPWSVFTSSDRQGCFVSRTFPAPRRTTLLFGLDADGSNRLTILNANWSIREKEQLRLNFRFSNATFPRHLAVGIAADGKRGFVASFGSGFPATFAASAFLRIARGDLPVEDLTLDGSGAAVAALRTCVGALRGAGGSGTDDNGIPLDPFAAKTARRSGK